MVGGKEGGRGGGGVAVGGTWTDRVGGAPTSSSDGEDKLVE